MGDTLDSVEVKDVECAGNGEDNENIATVGRIRNRAETGAGGCKGGKRSRAIARIDEKER